MIKVNVQAFVAGWAAEAIRDAIPTDSDFMAAELFSAADKAAVFRELERLANQLLAEAMRLEAL
jgi:hypothetical protein